MLTALKVSQINNFSGRESIPVFQAALAVFFYVQLFLFQQILIP